MEVEILEWTNDPVELISRCAGICYGKDDANIERVRNCFKRGHMGVFEHASVTFEISGISRACSHQLVRHRMASYNQQSQRYCKLDNSYSVVVPESIILADMWRDYTRCTTMCLETYKKMLDAGVPAEDARYVLQEGGLTSIVVTMNVRELFHFLDLRTDKHAQWEIRALANEMKDAVGDIDDQWADLIELWESGE